MIGQLRVIDSHTCGEPTRVILPGQIPLAGDTMAERRNEFLDKWDHLRRGAILEPRGSDILVGALLTPPVEPGSKAGVIFFNDVGGLGMCGHGTMGVVETLRHMGELQAGAIRLDTPVGTASAELLRSGEVSITNVASRRTRQGVVLQVEGIGQVVGDIAWGGNWFFLVKEPRFAISVSCQAELTSACWAIRGELTAQGITGDLGSEIDHVELFSDSAPDGADSQNFVQCPGGAYDRSPCGTGTSAKLACHFADGLLKEGEEYRQMSVTGSVFRGSVSLVGGEVIPTVIGRAWVTGESTLFFAHDDPLAAGVPQG